MFTYFSLSKIFWLFFQPAHLMLLLLLLLSLFCWFKRRDVLIRVCLGVLVLSYLAVAILPWRSMLLSPLEHRYERPYPMPSEIAGIIVLGGAIDPELSAKLDLVTVGDGGDRIINALLLARLYPKVKIIYVGGGGKFQSEIQREADWAGRMFLHQGIGVERIMLERESRNTAENAAMSYALVKPDKKAWLLVTSAYHMPRAVSLFNQVGWNIIPWPVEFTTVAEPTYLPQFNFTDGLDALNRAAHEYIGLALSAKLEAK